MLECVRAVAAADGSAVSCFLRVSDHLESIYKIFFFTENFDFRISVMTSYIAKFFKVPEVKIFSEKKKFANRLQMV